MRRASTCCTASLEACSQLSKMLGCFCPQNNHYTYPTFTRTTTAIYGTCFDIISVYFELKSMNHLPLHVVMIVNSQSSAHYLSRDHFPAFRLGVLAFIQPALLTLGKYFQLSSLDGHPSHTFNDRHQSMVHKISEINSIYLPVPFPHHVYNNLSSPSTWQFRMNRYPHTRSISTIRSQIRMGPFCGPFPRSP